MNTAEIG